MSLHLTIDPEFESKIPLLREEELHQLEENILADGVVINPLIVWNGVIVDGHNRYRILQQHPKIQFTTYEKEFPDRYAAIAWICKNQLGRRNLTPQQFKYLVGQQYEAEKLANQFRGNQYTSLNRSACDQIGHKQKPTRTRLRIAQETQTSEGYVERASAFSRGVDAAEEAVPGIKQEILTGSEEKPKPKRSAAETLQAIRDISENMLQSNGEIDADDICAELEDALDTMIFRWDTCLENNREQRRACRDGIKSLAEKGIHYLQKMRRTT